MSSLEPLWTFWISKPEVMAWDHPQSTHMKNISSHEINYRDHIGLKELCSHCHWQICQGPKAHHLSSSEHLLVDFTNLHAQVYNVVPSSRHLYEVFFYHGKSTIGITSASKNSVAIVTIKYARAYMHTIWTAPSLLWNLWMSKTKVMVWDHQ